MANLVDWFIGTQHAGGELLYWLSQIALACVAIVVAPFANNQVKTFKLLELLKYLEQPHVREARRTVRIKIEPLVATGEEWWKRNDELESAASIVCASFNTTAGVLRLGWSRRLPHYFARHWGQSIVANYKILEPLIKSRRVKYGDDDYMGDFRWLYHLARKHVPASPPRLQRVASQIPTTTPLHHDMAKPL